MKHILIFSLFWLACAAHATTYYIDFVGGSDASAGTSTGTAWKRHPYMTGWSGSYTHAAADRFIFKGGVTWTSGCFPWTVTGSGSSGAGRDYYGIDATWYTGGSWTRPVFDRQYVSASTNLLTLSGCTYVDFDNLELCHLNASTADGPGLIADSGGATNVTVKNCYLHGWRTASTSDGAHGGVIIRTFSVPLTFVLDNTEVENSENTSVQQNGVCVRCVAVIQNGCRIHDNSSAVLYCIDFNGSYLYNITGTSFGDNAYHANGIYLDPQTMGASQGYIRNSYLHDVAGGANMVYPNIRAGDTVTMYNNVLYGTMSSQLAVEIDPYEYTNEGPGSFIAYNNTIYNYNSSSTAFHMVTRSFGVAAGNNYVVGAHYLIVSVGTTDYTAIGAASNTAGLAFVATSTSTVGTGVANKYATAITLINNHVINASSLTDTVQGQTTLALTNTTNLSQSAATATTQGYVLGNLYAPTSTSVGTYNTGTSESGTFTADILGIARPQAAVWDIGAYEYIASGGTGGSAALGNISFSGRITIK
jgi:hypothetical protein